MTVLKDDEWGTQYTGDIKVPVWEFSFTVSSSEVFSDGNDKLALLIAECANVPMITRLDEWSKIEGKLDTTDEWRNISFRIINED